jgi:hypothetical protein
LKRGRKEGINERKKIRRWYKRECREEGED